MHGLLQGPPPHGKEPAHEAAPAPTHGFVRSSTMSNRRLTCWCCVPTLLDTCCTSQQASWAHVQVWNPLHGFQQLHVRYSRQKGSLAQPWHGQSSGPRHAAIHGAGQALLLGPPRVSRGPGRSSCTAPWLPSPQPETPTASQSATQDAATPVVRFVWTLDDGVECITRSPCQAPSW